MPAQPSPAIPREKDPRGNDPRETHQGRFGSILFDEADGVAVADGPPRHFSDLNLDQLVAAIVAGRTAYDLTGFFYTPLTSGSAVRYRQEIFRDLEQTEVADCITRFGEDVTEMRSRLARSRRLRFSLQRQGWHLAAALAYGDAVERLEEALGSLPLSSAGLSGFARFLSAYRASAGFQELVRQSADARSQLDAVTYRLRVHGDRVDVSRPQEEADYAADVAAAFARFRQGGVRSYRSNLGFYEEMNHVEEAIASRVAALFPAAFLALEAFCARHGDFTDESIMRFDREVQVYLAYLQYVARMRAAGLPVCYPEISEKTTPLVIRGGYDAALADKLTAEDGSVVTNDVELSGPERIWVVTGPNQGGKTTYARMIGQLHYLASLGFPVPAGQATLPLVDAIFTHFERGENLHDLTGKLDDDLVRIRDILNAATPSSLLIINEIFTSTSVDDALWLATRVIRRVITLECLCVCVTFLDELASLSDATVSMVGTVAPDDPATRTFRIQRRPADGRAYADAVAERYGLSVHALKRRLPS